VVFEFISGNVAIERFIFGSPDGCLAKLWALHVLIRITFSVSHPKSRRYFCMVDEILFHLC
jgi:hypothetical protein